MARIRTIKPEWLEDEALATCSDAARVLSVALITLADDYGNGRGSAMFLASRVWPYDEDLSEVSRKLAEACGELEEMGYVRFYTVKNQRYCSIVNWDKHQRVDNAGKPRVPAPPVLAETRGDSRLDHDHEGDHEGTPSGGVDSPKPVGDWRIEWAESFRRITGRDDFADGCGQYTGLEDEALRGFRKTCRGDHGFFVARLAALMAADSTSFLPRQGLGYWTDTAIKTDHTKLKATGAAMAPERYRNEGSLTE